MKRAFAIQLLSFVAPFFILYGVDYFVFGRYYSDILAGEAIHHYFHYGGVLAVLDGAPLLDAVSHHPGLPMTLLAAITVALTGFPQDDLFTLAGVGLAFNIVMILAAGVFWAALADRLAIPIWVGVLSASLTAVAPGVATYSGAMVAYSTYAFLVLPVGLGFVALADQRDGTDRLVNATFLVLGFLMSVVFVAGIVVVAVGLAIIATLRRPDGGPIYRVISHEASGRWTRWAIHLALFLFVTAVFAFALRAGMKIASTHMGETHNVLYHGLGPVWVRLGAAVPAVLVTVACFRLSWLRPVLYGAGGMGLVGWLVGTNIFAFDWPMAAFLSLTAKGGDPNALPSFVQMLQHIDLSGFMAASIWRWIIPLLLVIGVAAVIRSFRAGGDDRLFDRFVGIYVVAVVGLNVMAAANISMLDISARTYDTGRYFILLFAAIPAALTWVWKRRRLLRRAVVGAATALAVLSAADYGAMAWPLTRTTASLEAKVSALIRERLAAYPDVQVLCSDTFISQACSLAHGYWVLSLSKPEFVSRTWGKSRIRMAWSKVEIPPNPTLVISTRMPPALPGRTRQVLLHWSEPQGRANMATSLYVVFYQAAP